MPKITPIEEKIALLLSKAESTTPEEAEALTAQASRLMIKHGIQEAVIEAQRAAIAGRVAAPTDVVVERRFVFDGVHAPMWIRFGHALANGYGGLRTMQAKNRYARTQTLYVVGFSRDVEAFAGLLTSLQQQGLTAQKAWWKGYHRKTWLDQGERFRERRQFLLSFAYRASERLRQQRVEIVEEVGGASTDLVLVNRETQVNDWIAQKYGTLRSGRGRAAYSGSSYASSAGRSAAERANTGATALSGMGALGR